MAQVSRDDKGPIYNALYRDRIRQLGKALKAKYKTAETLNENIEILERLVSIGMTLNSDHLIFAIEEADNLKEPTDLTYARKLRRDWLPDINSENESHIVAKLLPEASTSLEIATIAQYVEGLTISERLVNTIAASIYAQIDKITGKYEDFIPA